MRRCPTGGRRWTSPCATARSRRSRRTRTWPPRGAPRSSMRKANCVSPPFVDAHFHMDATLSLRPAARQRVGHAARRHRPVGRAQAFTHRAGTGRAGARLLRLGGGPRTARDPLARRRLRSATARRRGAARRARTRRARISISSWSRFRRMACCARRARRDNLRRALDQGVDVVGGIPHFERTMVDGTESVRILCELAAERGLRVDMHCDETDDPLSRHIETLALRRRNGSGFPAASPARISRRCTRWTTTTCRS